jgi:hypothetical protein
MGAYSVVGAEKVAKVGADSVSMVIKDSEAEDELEELDDSTETDSDSDSEEDEEARAEARDSSAERTSWLEIHSEMGPVDSEEEEDSAAAAASSALSAAS